MLYAIQAGDDDGPIKLGYTRRALATRLADLQTGNHEQLHLLAVCHGSRRDEVVVHARHWSTWIRGEWYSATPRLLRLLGRWHPCVTWDGRAAPWGGKGIGDVGSCLVISSAQGRLHELPRDVIALLDDERLTYAHGRALLRCDEQDTRSQLARRAVAEGWTFRRLEAAAWDAHDAEVALVEGAPA